MLAVSWADGAPWAALGLLALGLQAPAPPGMRRWLRRGNAWLDRRVYQRRWD